MLIDASDAGWAERKSTVAMQHSFPASKHQSQPVTATRQPPLPIGAGTAGLALSHPSREPGPNHCL